VDLIITDRHGAERRRVFKVATKRIDGRLHAIGRLTSPEYLRGMAIMTIENSDRSSDAFVYLPSVGKARRITAAQRSDTFLGSDLTYDDLGPARMSEYEVTIVRSVRSEAEAARLIRASPLSPMNYDHVDFVIAESDLAILEARYFKRGQDEPYRSVHVPRRWIRTGEGYALPTYLIIRNRLRDTTTEVRIRDLAINPSVDDSEFSLLSLEREAPPLAHPQ
jgi:hypothetical protein